MIHTIIEDSWSHPWEGFRSSYETCTQEELDWAHQSYSEEDQEAGWPKTGSIASLLNHVGACKAAYTNSVQNPSITEEQSDWSASMSKTAIFSALENVNTAFIQACATADPDVRIMGKGGHSFAEFIGIALRHEMWHAGQIACVRRLYKHNKM